MFIRSSEDFSKLKIGLASSDQIRFWSHGEVEKPETINYRTFKPEKKGLFCERIFGPVKDWECSCGKYRKVRYRGITCERCGVEITHSKVRRERMGHIELATAVTHIWFLKGIPGYIGLVLDVFARLLEEVIYYDAYIVTEVAPNFRGPIKEKQILREKEYQEAKENYGNAFKAEMGAKPIRDLLAKIDIDKSVKSLKEDLKEAGGQKKLRIIKRLRVLEAFKNSGNRPEWMIIEALPVIPPDLRPMVQLEGGRFATSDLNDLYRRVVNRNNRLKRLIEIGAPEVIIRNEKRMLQEAVDVLIDNGRRGRPVTGSNGRPLKSLSDIIEGKQGRFRQNLLGKRVDYAGRSVIVIGPNLKLNQCGLPREMALELFKPFCIRKLIERGFVQNVKSAKRKIERRDVVVWDVLEEIIKDHPVLLNRAPTLHRLGIQAFEPILVRGKAIQIHPLVCTAFNADFDGDQMAVHVPLSIEAQAEARLLMMSSGNLLSPASGRPIITPTQDMVLGCHYLTIDNDKEIKGKGKIFANDNEVVLAYDLGIVDLHAKIEVRRARGRVVTTPGRIIFNQTLNEAISRHQPGKSFAFINQTLGKRRIEHIIKECFIRFGADATAEVADEIKNLGFKFATRAGISIGVDDLKVPPKKKHIINTAIREVEEFEKMFRKGVISRREKIEKSINIWARAVENITDAMLVGFDKLNSVYMMAFSGARGSVTQVRQLAGVRGLMADPSGNIIELPIKTNFREGLNVTEFFISSYGARKGLVDTALRTADSGYLTRRLVDVAQDIMITEEDCKTKAGIDVSSIREGLELILPLENRIIGRVAAKKIVDTVSKNTILEAGEEINEDNVSQISASGAESVSIRSPLICAAEKGICRKCYGRDLAFNHLVDIGEAVGIIAAQSIGEPGTQLTMRTFHTGGIALHKASKVVIKAKHAGTIKFSEGLQLTKIKTEKDAPFNVVVREGSIIIATIGGKPESHLLPIGSILHVEEGSKVEVADLLADFDPAFEYIISDSDGKVRMFNFDVVEKKDPQGRVFKVAKGDGEIIVLNPDLHKEFSIPADTELNVSRGDKVRIGTDICGGVVSDVTGVISEIHRSSNPKGYVTVTLGESYPIHAGARILIEDGKSVHADDVLAIEEKTGYDPSKTKDIIQGLPRVEELFEARRPKDSALVAEIDGRVEVVEAEGLRKIVIHAKGNRHNEYLVPFGVRLRVHSGTEVTKGVQLTEGTLSPHDILKTRGIGAVQRFLVDEVQKVYRSQGVEINDKHIEVIVVQMTKKLKITLTGESSYLPGQLVDKKDLQKTNEQLDTNKQELSEGEVFLLGITKASLTTKSFLSAASFQETARVLSEAALYGREDEMYGLKENVIIGKLIPAGTGLASFRQIKLKANGTYLEEEQSLVPTFEV